MNWLIYIGAIWGIAALIVLPWLAWAANHAPLVDENERPILNPVEEAEAYLAESAKEDKSS